MKVAALAPHEFPLVVPRLRWLRLGVAVLLGLAWVNTTPAHALKIETSSGIWVLVCSSNAPYYLDLLTGERRGANDPFDPSEPPSPCHLICGRRDGGATLGGKK